MAGLIALGPNGLAEISPGAASFVADGALSSRTASSRAAGEVMSVAEFLLPTDTTWSNAITAAMAHCAANGPRIYQLPAGALSIDVPAGNQIGNGSGEGTAFKLTSAHSGFVLRGVRGQTFLSPVSNKIEMFSQNGASNLVFADISFDNTANGLLQNQVKGTGSPLYAGVASYGNNANAAIAQVRGDSLTVIGCKFAYYNLCIGYVGTVDDQTVLVGDLVVDDCTYISCCFGCLPQQAKTIRFTRIRSSGFVNSINADASVDPGHPLYVTNRPGAQPYSVIVDDIQDYNGASSAVKVRKGQLVVISNVCVYLSGKGVEVFNSYRVTISNCNVAIATFVGVETNQAAFELTDVGPYEISNCIADVRGADAWGFRIRVDVSPTFANQEGRLANTTVIIDNAYAAGKAPYVIGGQVGMFIDMPRIVHYGTIANSQPPISIGGCTNLRVRLPSHRCPNFDGTNPTDAAKLATVDATSVNCHILYDPNDIDTTTTSSTVINAGSNPVTTLVGNSTTFPTFLTTGAGTISAPSIGVNYGGQIFGFYNTGTNTWGVSINANVTVKYFTNRTTFVKDLWADTDGLPILGGPSGARFGGVNIAPISTPPVTPVVGMMRLVVGATSVTSGVNTGFGSSGDGYYGYFNGAWQKF